MPEKRKCEFCGKPLPADSAHNRKLHVECRRKKYMAKLYADAGRRKPAA